MKKAMAHSEEAAVNVAMDAKEATTVAEEAGDCLEEGTQICFCECLKSFLVTSFYVRTQTVCGQDVGKMKMIVLVN